MAVFKKMPVLILKFMYFALWPCTTDMNELTSLPHAFCPWHCGS